MHAVFDKTEESALYWKGKVVPVSDTKKRRGSSGMAPFILSFRARWSWVFSFTCRPLYLGEGASVTAEQEAGWFLK